MRRGRRKATNQSRPDRRFRRRVPAAAAVAALIAAAPGYAVVRPTPASRPGVARTARQSAVPLREIPRGGIAQTVGSKR